ncbi:hypothetical protein GGR57DRAFT_508251 [Xylariaceae sp. FL1272]|nr:hypothetical protein GGR57DRAFT_508251 [Xylariaceae sp. FL1272]
MAPTSFTHDCSLHHEALPARQDVMEKGTEMNVHAYDAPVLEQGIENAVKSANDTPLLQQQYEFVTDFILADTENAPYQEMVGILNNWLLHIDQYFFPGGLTQRQQKLVRLRVFDRTWNAYPKYGFSKRSIQSPLGIIYISLRSSISGKRYPKIVLLTTLVRELAHAYLATFFNYCPVNDNDLYLTGPNDDGYGPLWSAVYGGMYRHIRTWHPSLAGLETEMLTHHVPAKFVDLYQRFMQGLPFYRTQWDASDIEFEQHGLLRWPNQRAELKRALLRLSYTQYEQFVEHKAPNIQDAFHVALFAFVFLFVLPIFFALYCLLFR